MTAKLGLLGAVDDFCAIGDHPLYCGCQAVLSLSGSALARDRSLERGLPHDAQGWLSVYVDGAFGHFPDDAWLLTSSGSLASPSATVVHHWVAGRWRAVKSILTDRSLIRYISLGRGRAVVARNEHEPLLEGLGTLQGVWRLLGPDAPPGKPCGALSWVHALVGFDDGSLIGLTNSGCDSAEVIEHWASPDARPVIERLPHEDADGDRIVYIEGIWGTRPDNLIAYGNLSVPNLKSGDTSQALLARLEDGHWTRLSVPPLLDDIVVYAVDAHGREWILASTPSEPMANYHLWTRVWPNDWSKVPLPVRCQPWELQLIGGDVWVLCDAPPTGDDRPRFILSTRAPSMVLDLDEALQDPSEAASSSQSP